MKECRISNLISNMIYHLFPTYQDYSQANVEVIHLSINDYFIKFILLILKTKEIHLWHQISHLIKLLHFFL